MCTRRKAGLFAFLLMLTVPLFAESIRSQNKTYFDSMQWEELKDLAIPQLPEAYTMERNQPVPYSDTIDDGGIYPSLPQLGTLDYQNIPEDLLRFCDTVAAALTDRSVPAELFTAQKPFLPHLARFLAERLPAFSYAFYGRPSFKQDGSALLLFRLTVKQDGAAPADTATADETTAAAADTPDKAVRNEATAMDAPDTAARDEDAAAADGQDGRTARRSDADAAVQPEEQNPPADSGRAEQRIAQPEAEQTEQTSKSAETKETSPVSAKKDAPARSEDASATAAATEPHGTPAGTQDAHSADSGGQESETAQNARSAQSNDSTAEKTAKPATDKKAQKAAAPKYPEIPALFDTDKQPLFIMIELTAPPEGGAWKINSLDLKGAEYSDYALKD